MTTPSWEDERPPELAAVRRDDALLDAISARGERATGQEDDPLASLLGALVSDVGAAPLPDFAAPPRPGPGRRGPGGRRLPRTFVALGVTTVVLATTGVAAAGGLGSGGGHGGHAHPLQAGVRADPPVAVRKGVEAGRLPVVSRHRTDPPGDAVTVGSTTSGGGGAGTPGRTTPAVRKPGTAVTPTPAPTPMPSGPPGFGPQVTPSPTPTASDPEPSDSTSASSSGEVPLGIKAPETPQP